MVQSKRCSICGCIRKLLCATFIIVIGLIIPTLALLSFELLPETEADPEDCVDPFLEPENLEATIKDEPPLFWVFNIWLHIWKQIIYWSILVYVMNVFVQIYEKFLAIMSGHSDHGEDRQQSPFEIACKRYGALVIVYPKQVIYPEYIAQLLELEAISYGIRPAAVTYDEFDPNKLLTTKHIIFIFPKVDTMPTEVSNLIQKLGVKDFVRDAFDDLKFSIFYPQCCNDFAETLSSGMQMYQAKPVPEEMKSTEWNDLRKFRNWSNDYWVHNLLDITRLQLMNRILKPNPIFEQNIVTQPATSNSDNDIVRCKTFTPYENHEAGSLEFKEPIADAKGQIHGWQIGVRIEDSSNVFVLGEQVRFLFSNNREDVHFICEKLDINPIEHISIKHLESHFPKPLCPSTCTPEVALMYYYDIYSPISGIMYNTLSFFAVDDHEILKLSSFGTDLLTFGKCAYPDLPSLLRDFKSISMDFVDLIMLLPRISHKSGHITQIHIQDSTNLVDIALVSHSESEPETYIKHIAELKQNDLVLLQHTSVVNSYYSKLPELQKQFVVFFVQDISMCSISNFLSSCREALDWHIIFKPNQYLISTLQEEYDDGKIQSLHSYDRPLSELECMKKLQHLKHLVVCIISPKSEFESYRNNICDWNPALSRHELEQSSRWLEIDTTTI